LLRARMRTRGLTLGALGRERPAHASTLGCRAWGSWRPTDHQRRQRRGGRVHEEPRSGIEQRNEHSLLRVERSHHPCIRHWILKQSRCAQRCQSFTSAVERQALEPVAAERYQRNRAHPPDMRSSHSHATKGIAAVARWGLGILSRTFGSCLTMFNESSFPSGPQEKRMWSLKILM
jgi:hypothetical protein